MKWKILGHLLSTIAISCLGSIAFAQQVDDVAHIGFGESLDDAVVAEFIERQNVHPTGFFMWAHGSNITYKSYSGENNDLTPSELVQKAREKALSISKEGIESSKQEAHRFVRYSSKAIISRDKKVEQRARQSLKYYEQHKLKVAHIEQGLPLIHGLEYKAPLSKLHEIRDDDFVEIIGIRSEDLTYGAMLKSGLNINPPPKRMSVKTRDGGIKPIVYMKRYQNADIDAMTPDELWEQLKILAELFHEQE